MAKIKVHELAKELEIQSKEVIAFLQEKGYEVQAAQSSIEDDAIALVKEKFGKEVKPVAAAEKAESAPAAEKAESAPAADKAAPPKKKKTIIFVSNPHNSTSLKNSFYYICKYIY